MDVVKSRFEVLRNLGPNGLLTLVSDASSKLPSWLLVFCVEGWRWRSNFCESTP